MRRILLSFSLFCAILATTFTAMGSKPGLEDPYGSQYVLVEQDTLPPRFEDFINSQNANPFDLHDPSVVEQSVEYDPETGNYIVTETIGGDYFRPPTYLTFDEYMEYRRQKEEENYFKELMGVGTDEDSGIRDPIKKLKIDYNPIDKLFGGTEVDIRKQGSIDLMFGLDYQTTDNSQLTASQASPPLQFDFDMDIKMNVTGKIGEKLNLTTNYNSAATFNFDNQIKLDYNSDLFGEDDIIKRIEAGNVGLPLRGTLIQGAQNLFGLKTELQFGHLRLTAVATQQQSKNENIRLEGGSQVQEFEVPADQYDENRHFFLTHYNRDHYEEALKDLPFINSLFQTKNIEVWLTNDRREVQNVRDIVALADLSEPVAANFVNSDPSIVAENGAFAIRDINGQNLPANEANTLWETIQSLDGVEEIDQTITLLQQKGLVQGKDFEKVSARKLSPSEYTINPLLGFISLNINVQPDQVLGVSFSYDYNGKIGIVGQSSIETADISTDTLDPTPKVLFVKMLKSTTQSTDIPTWDLMMKNVYSIGAYQVGDEDFRLDIFYDDPGKGNKRFLPTSCIQGEPLLEVFNLDRLNSQNDPQPDGRFDFVPGTTINPANGRIYFPKLEPFGDALEESLCGITTEIDKYVYADLYRKTLFNAIENAEKNRFVIKGSFKSSVTSEISLGAFNIPEGSVTVTAGGRLLVEYKDYEVDYSTGRLRILNDAILASGAPINISFEDNTLFGFQQKAMLGIRADYEVGKNLNIGATALKLFERPFTPKVNIGDDPVNNSIYGLDINFSKEVPWITKAVNWIPLISTKAPSNVTFMAETAYLRPGHSSAINESKEDKGGVVYIDDFEGSASSLDMRTPSQWVLSSVPQGELGDPDVLFPEATGGETASGVNRALINWFQYRSSSSSFGNSSGPTTSGGNSPYSSTVPQDEVFPNKKLTPNQFSSSHTLNLVFNPTARGPYNFDEPDGSTYSAGVTLSADAPGYVQLKEPETRWGGIMREIQQSDFQTANIEFLEFWMLSPFLKDDDATSPAANADGRQGTLYINLGNVSEDILKDSRRFYENGLPKDNQSLNLTDDTPWGVVPINNPISRAFDNAPGARENQDLGFDGLTDANEALKFNTYLSTLNGLNPTVAASVALDPSNDNFKPTTDPAFENLDDVDKYRFFNHPQGNAITNTDNAVRAQSLGYQPDTEDVNDDNSLNESENYYEWAIPIQRVDGTREIDLMDNPFITDVREADNGRIWYRYRIPITSNATDNGRKAVGNINDFRSIRFMRMYMHGFEEPVVLRFATLDLVRNQWRTYSKLVDDPMSGDCIDPVLDVDAVNIEENSSRTPFNYTLPSGIAREESVGVFSTLQNEQSLVLHLEDLCQGGSNGVFKVVENDLRLYEKLKMFVHAENIVGKQEVAPGELSVFLRIGSDIQENYYEYEIPLVMSDSTLLPEDRNANTSSYKDEVWKAENEFDFELKQFKDLKIERNGIGGLLGSRYGKAANVPGHKITIKGNPTLGRVKIAMIGVRNNVQGAAGGDRSAEIWVNELRVSGLDERGGFAGLARMDVQLADFGNLSVAGNFSTIGFGALDQRVAERSREKTAGYDLSTTLHLDKFLPKKWGIKLPFYGQISNTIATPEYDPYDLDITLKEKISLADTQEEKQEIKDLAQEATSIRAFNFTNVRKESTGGGKGGKKKSMPWDIENLSASYAYTDTKKRNPLIQLEREERYKASLDYGYSHSPKYIMPFKKIKSKHLKLISQINFNPIPGSFTVSNYFDRKFSSTRYRFTGLAPEKSTYYAKYFKWERDYSLNWNLTKSLKFNFNALAASTIDEPDERRIRADSEIDNFNRYRRDSILTNLGRLGRPKNYKHNISVSYTLPIRYLPYMDWTTVRVQYKADYAWTAGSLVEEKLGLGNVIQNGQNRQANVDLNFEKLYKKSAYLKKINKRKKRKKKKKGKKASKSKKTQKKNTKGKKAKKKREREPQMIERILIRPLLLVRRAKFNYTESFQTVVPGFMPQSSLLGLSQGFADPGWGFVAGLQPKIRTLEGQFYDKDDWLYNSKSSISESALLNQKVIQRYTQNYDAKLTLEPIPDLKIDIELKRSYTDDYQERFKREDFTSTDHAHTGISRGGSMTISYAALNTLFADTTEAEALFQTFRENQVILSNRLGTGIHQDTFLAQRGFAEGYGPNQQEVSLPAFIAAYTRQDAATMNLDLFSILPRVNWSVKYNGLTKIPALKEMFSKFSFSHSYKSSLTINRYATNDRYTSAVDNGTSLRNDDGNFYSKLEIPQLVIEESFSPLIGVDMTMQNGLSLNVDYKKARNLNLSAINNSLTERKSKAITIGAGYRIRNVDIPFLTGSKRKGKKKKKKGKEDAKKKKKKRGGGISSLDIRDLDFQFDFSLRDDVTFNRKLDLNTDPEPTKGNYQLSFSPSIEYKLNKHLSLRLFFDYRKTKPKTGNSFETVNSSGGVVVRFEL